jgi:hypothetical protein
MKAQKDRHLDAPGEANRDKHINFLAEENGDTDPADEKFDVEKNDTDEDADNGFFTNDDNQLQTKEENENDKRDHPSTKNEQVSPLNQSEQTTLGDRISINKNNDDLLTRVKDDNNTAYTNEISQEQ